jgi:hypothetical protein
MSAIALRDVYGTPDPDDLAYKAWVNPNPENLELPGLTGLVE